jgi:hypothetical protein
MAGIDGARVVVVEVLEDDEAEAFVNTSPSRALSCSSVRLIAADILVDGDDDGSGLLDGKGSAVRVREREDERESESERER